MLPIPKQIKYREARRIVGWSGAAARLSRILRRVFQSVRAIVRYPKSSPIAPDPIKRRQPPRGEMKRARSGSFESPLDQAVGTPQHKKVSLVMTATQGEAYDPIVTDCKVDGDV
jgi:hypothetical protein